MLDCGLFHVLEDDNRAVYVKTFATRSCRAGYFMLCFSDREPGDLGPRRITRAEIESAFARGWHVDSSEAAKIESTRASIEAWLASITRG